MMRNRTDTYWDSKGTHQALATRLQALIPSEGSVTGKGNTKLERLRKITNAYYDIFNNGGINRATSIRHFFGCSVSQYRNRRTHVTNWDALHRHTEPVLDVAILDAALEQGMITEREHLLLSTKDRLMIELKPVELEALGLAA